MQLGLPWSDDSAASLPERVATHDSLPAGAAPAPPSVDRSALHGMIFVRHRRAKRYVLRVMSDGRVRVTIPRGGSKAEATAFAARHVAWVARQVTRRPARVMAGGEFDALRLRAAVELPRRLLELAVQHGLHVQRVSIRNQRTRWGSCGRDGHISLNWRLMAMPDWVRDYVLIHELMHLVRMDHSPQYWALVERACPTYQRARAWLREHGASLR